MNSLNLSVALCTYNGQAHLAAQLNSLLAQVRLPDEVLVGDDASTDSTWNILQKFAERASEMGVKVELKQHKTNMGFVANFSDTLSRATGEVIFLCDQDDVWWPDKLATMEAQFAANPDLLMLGSDARLVDARGSNLGQTAFAAIGLSASERRCVRGGRAFEVLLRRSMLVGATIALRRKLLGRAFPVGAGWIHDEWLAAIASATGRIDIIERPLIDYRQHEANQVGLRDRGMADWWRDMLRERHEELVVDLTRIDSLRTKMSELGKIVLPARLEDLRRKQRHVSTRANMGFRPRVLRLPSMFREVCNGNYRRYGTGIRMALRDVLRRG